jgi:hypothetical protein
MSLELEVIRLRNQGLSLKKIKATLGCSSSTVSKYVHGLGDDDSANKRAVIIADRVRREEIAKSNRPIDRLKNGSGKSYSAFYNRAKRQALKEALAIIVPSCPFCTYDRCREAFHCHHIDPDSKLFQVSGPEVIRRPVPQVLEELCKCAVMCSNCHCEVHDDLIDSATVERHRFRSPEQLLEIWESILQRALLTRPSELLGSKAIVKLNRL